MITDNLKKEFEKKFEKLSYNKNTLSVWHDFIDMTAYFLSALGGNNEHLNKGREMVKHFGRPELITEMWMLISDSYEVNTKQDFLGEFYMKHKFGDAKKGQYFTPYPIAELMANLSMRNFGEELEKKSWITVNDCCCGSGAMLIGAYNFAKEKGITGNDKVLYIGQDLDPLIAKMAYIQLSILGCAGYTVVGNTLYESVRGTLLNPIRTEKQEIWYMPGFAIEIWQIRRLFDLMDN